jgi:hypothetical protein
MNDIETYIETLSLHIVSQQYFEEGTDIPKDEFKFLNFDVLMNLMRTNMIHLKADLPEKVWDLIIQDNKDEIDDRVAEIHEILWSVNCN